MKNKERALWDIIVKNIKKHSTKEDLPETIALNLKTYTIFSNQKEMQKAMFEITQEYWLEEKVKLSLSIQEEELFEVIEEVEDMYLYYHLQLSDLNEILKELIKKIEKK